MGHPGFETRKVVFFLAPSGLFHAHSGGCPVMSASHRGKGNRRIHGGNRGTSEFSVFVPRPYRESTNKFW